MKKLMRWINALTYVTCLCLLPPTADGQQTTTMCQQTPRTLRECILNAINNQNWTGFVELCDPSNLNAQKEIGIAEYQYIAEALGLHMVNNSLEGNIAQKSTLEQLEKISLRRAGKPDSMGCIDLTGTAILKNGEKLKVNIHMQRRLNGTFWITPAVG